MKNFSVCCLIVFSMISCGGEKETEAMVSEDNTINTLVTECDCKELMYDAKYNSFYLDVPKDGFSGICKTYYRNGQVELDKNMLNGKTHGTVLSYYENGQLKSSKEFDMNLQVGKHMAYSEDGRLIFYGLYERGRLVKKIVSQPIQR